MKKALHFLIALCCCILFLSGCTHYSSTKRITGFNFLQEVNTQLAEDYQGEINQSEKEISVLIAYNIDRSSLIPSIDFNGTILTPGDNQPQDFTRPVTYTVVAEDDSRVNYIVTVTNEATYTITGMLVNGLQYIHCGDADLIHRNANDVIQFQGVSLPDTEVAFGLEDPFTAQSIMIQTQTDDQGFFYYPENYFSATTTHVLQPNSYYSVLFGNGQVITFTSRSMEDHINSIISDFSFEQVNLAGYHPDGDSLQIDPDILEYVRAIQNFNNGETVRTIDWERAMAGQDRIKQMREERLKEQLAGLVSTAEAGELIWNGLSYGQDIITCSYGLAASSVTFGGAMIMCGPLLYHIVEDLVIDPYIENSDLSQGTKDIIMGSKGIIVAVVSRKITPQTTPEIFKSFSDLDFLFSISTGTARFMSGLPGEYNEIEYVQSVWHDVSGNEIEAFIIPYGEETPPESYVNPPSLDFNENINSSEYITIRNDGGGTLGWTASANRTWIDLSHTNGSCSAGNSSTVTVSILWDALTQGTTNTGTITIHTDDDDHTVFVTAVKPDDSPISYVNTTFLDLHENTNASDSFTIRNDGGGTLGWNASANRTWINLSRTNGTCTAGNSNTVTVSIIWDALTPGTTNTGTITIDTDDDDHTVFVTAVKPDDLPISNVNPTFLDLDEATNTSDSFIIRNDGGGTLGWNASANRSWINLSRTSGSCTAGNSNTVTVSITWDALTPGTSNTGTITIDTDDDDHTVFVTAVRPEDPPISYVSTTSINVNEETNASDSFTIRNDGGGILDWTASASPSWINLSRTSGNCTAGNSNTVTVTITWNALTPGTSNTGTITIDTNDNDHTVFVMAVKPEDPPILYVNTTSLRLDEDTNASDSFTIRNDGGGTLGWTASASQTWINLSRTNGSCTAGNSSTVYVYIDWNSLAPGTTYTVTIYIVTDAGDHTITVTVYKPWQTSDITITVNNYNSLNSHITWSSVYLDLYYLDEDSNEYQYATSFTCNSNQQVIFEGVYGNYYIQFFYDSPVGEPNNDNHWEYWGKIEFTANNGSEYITFTRNTPVLLGSNIYNNATLDYSDTLFVDVENSAGELNQIRVRFYGCNVSQDHSQQYYYDYHNVYGYSGYYRFEGDPLNSQVNVSYGQMDFMMVALAEIRNPDGTYDWYFVDKSIWYTVNLTN